MLSAAHARLSGAIPRGTPPVVVFSAWQVSWLAGHRRRPAFPGYPSGHDWTAARRLQLREQPRLWFRLRRPFGISVEPHRVPFCSPRGETINGGSLARVRGALNMVAPWRRKAGKKRDGQPVRPLESRMESLRAVAGLPSGRQYAQDEQTISAAGTAESVRDAGR